jgi:tetratricopeptide (TPR) repeat protein
VLAINPDNAEAHIGLGDVYASLGSHDQALEQYIQGVEDDPYGFNEIGLTHIHRFDPVKKKKDPVFAETFLRLALQRALVQEQTQKEANELLSDEEEKERANTLFQIQRNLGWALLNQRRFQEAKKHLELARDLDRRIAGDQLGGGMEYCFLAHLYTQQYTELHAKKLPSAAEAKTNAINNWQECRKHARPETIGEYKWFMDVGQNDLANCIDTSSIVRFAGLAANKTPNLQALFGDQQVTPKPNRNPLAVDCKLHLPWDPQPEGAQAAKIEALTTQLQALINQHWSDPSPDFQQSVVYQLQVTQDGKIIGYNPISEHAEAYAAKTPLPALITPVESFKVVFTPAGAFEITPEKD